MNETIEIPRHITRDYMLSSPYYFIYSSSVHIPKPHGQAGTCFGLSNCFPCPVRWKVSKCGLYNDNDIVNIKIEIEVALSKVPLDGTPIIPFPRMGEGASRMFEFAPKSHQWMLEQIKKIAYFPIVYI